MKSDRTPVIRAIKRPECLRVDRGYPEALRTLGDHIRTVRLDRKELQKEVAKAIGVSVETVLHWELHQTEVAVAHYPKIMEYLGYCPIPERAGVPLLGALVRLHRTHRGLSLRQAAGEIGADPRALSQWEQDSRRLFRASRAKLLRFIGQTE